MPWTIIERRLVRAGDRKRQQNGQREWTKTYGENRAVGYVLNGELVLQEDALEQVYVKSYEEHFALPRYLDALCALAKTLRNPHSR